MRIALGPFPLVPGPTAEEQRLADEATAAGIDLWGSNFTFPKFWELLAAEKQRQQQSTQPQPSTALLQPPAARPEPSRPLANQPSVRPRTFKPVRQQQPGGRSGGRVKQLAALPRPSGLRKARPVNIAAAIAASKKPVPPWFAPTVTYLTEQQERDLYELGILPSRRRTRSPDPDQPAPAKQPSKQPTQKRSAKCRKWARLLLHKKH
jgi:hypothetical protein